MIPRQKAIELIEKMSLGIAYKKIYQGASIETFVNKYCFTCAYIAVEEIIKDKKAFNQVSVEYWEEVKQEIENIYKSYS
jgi:hypothetical protein